MPALYSISALDRTAQAQIQARIDNKTKPLGALGQLEPLALQLALIQQTPTLRLSNPTLLVFAGDHGVAAEGVSIAPAAVTRQMVLNFLAGGAAINCFCRTLGWQLKVVDAGILEPIDDPRLITQRLGAGTANLALESAMSQTQCQQGLQLGAALARREIASGADLLAFGEMGIANTTSATALLAALTGAPVAACIGRGTGINDTQLAHKQALIEQAVARVAGQTDPQVLLAELGGFELVQICGAILAAAEARVPMLIDGFIVSAAALVACRIALACRDYMLFSHGSAEPGHARLLAAMQAEPLLDLGLRLGEGTGAALALPLLQAAVSFYNDMASFESAGVTV
ncbi:nicotinate-nucleotide--dimethylbenzimidazole phosphoribosyltransferase [Pseudaeromonas paramecii]|uniref:Nicotinate-nucleotide--dimethylbenzimidazole phosphoribosyltransferase n=1 Tax=Pseudaeromonas paramecii TaxID=2138166 RepID=A0ABP8PXR2_9GAMM